MKKSLVFAAAMLMVSPAFATTEELIESVKNDDLSAVLILLEKGEDVNGANEQGNTALHYAVAKDNAAITQALLLHGADINAANDKGWTPMKITQKKELKYVTPLLENAAEKLKQTQEETENSTEEISKDVKDRALKVIAAIEKKNADIAAIKQTVKDDTVEKIENKTLEIQQKADAELKKIETDEKSLKDELAQLKAENEALLEKLKTAENKVAEAAKEPAVKAIQSDIKKAEEKLAVKSEIKKAEAPKKEVKKEAKKPVAKKPQPTEKKVVLKPSSLNGSIYEGDEEIVYCLSYLGHGENQNMGKAAAYFASSAKITEDRYIQIANMANNYVAQSDGAGLQKRNSECAKIITPKNAEKKNRIIRSLNQSVGY